MDNYWYKYLIVFSNDAVWSRTNLLRRWKSESLISEALSLRYIEEIGTNDIKDPQYCITELGKKKRDF